MSDSVTCNECGTHIDVDTNENPDSRSPCPNCGSTARNISVSVKETVTVTASLDAVLTKASTADLLLQTVIIAGEKTEEGRLVEAVSIPWFDIIELLKKDPNVAFEIPPEKWEEIVAGAYSKAGFDEVTLTPRSGDYGRDVIIRNGVGPRQLTDMI